jgi:selenocysteine-specific elongation factor
MVWVVSPATWKRFSDSASVAIEAFHRAHPDLPGLAPARLAAALEPRIPARVSLGVVHALVEAGLFAAEAGAVRARDHRSGLDPRDEALWARLVPLLSGGDRFRPPRANEAATLLNEREGEVRRVLKALARRRDVIEVAPDHFFRRETVDEMAAIAGDVARSQQDGQFSAAHFRDRLNNGRKVAIQILEYFDRKGLTLRRGDLRRIDPRRLDSFTHPPKPQAVDPD